MKTADLLINVSIHATIKGIDIDCSLEKDYTTGNDFDDFLDEAKEELIELITSEHEDKIEIDEDEDFEELLRNSYYDLTHEIIDWCEIDEFENLKDIDLLNEIAEERDLEYHDWDIISAAIKLGIDISDINEAYQGQYDDDEDFAWQLANDIGAIDKNASWPNNCIDWEYAARELMYDYSEFNGYYFRNL